MSRDLFARLSDRPPSSTRYGFGRGSHSRAQNEGSIIYVPRDPQGQEMMDRIKAQEQAEAARREIELDTPEHRQRVAAAEVAKREQKRINFDFGRTMPDVLEQGWQHLMGDCADEEIRVYTTGNEVRRRFWGIKPAGMSIDEFWEQNDPEVSRWEDNIAVTWENPLIPPPITEDDVNNPVVWAGRGVNPGSLLPQLPVAEPPQSSKFIKPNRRQSTPPVNPDHRVTKSKPPTPKKKKKNAQNALAEKIDAGISRLESQRLGQEEASQANQRPSRNRRAATVTDTQLEPAATAEGSVPTKRPRGRPPGKTYLAPKNDTISEPKRPRGRPAKRRLAADAEGPPPSKRPRGRPPLKERPPCDQGNARNQKASQKPERTAAASNHKMRTRGKGIAELLQLP